MNLDEKLRKLKDISGYTAKEISFRCGIPLGTLNKIFSGSTKSVKTETLKKLSSFFNVPISYFIEENEEESKRSEEINVPLGFVRVAAATPRLKLGDADANATEIIKTLENLSEKKVKVAVFPELSLCGYTLSDLFYYDAVLKNCEKSLEKIRIFSYNYEMIFFVGCPLMKDGSIYNTAVAVSKGKILGVVPKKYVPNYNEFYEKRHFSGAPTELSDITVNGKKYPFGTNIIFCDAVNPDLKISAEICEDLWTVESPSNEHCVNGATLIVNLSASNEIIGKAEYRRAIVSNQSGKCVCAYVYSDAGLYESTTDLIFSGHNIIAENGKILSETELFSYDTAIADVDISFLEFERRKSFNYDFEKGQYIRVDFSLKTENAEFIREFPKMPFVPSENAELSARSELIVNMQANALARRVSHTKAKTLVIGISGGLDSTLALLSACKTVDLLGRSRKDILAITMPCFGTTERTKNNSVSLAEELGVTLKTIDITESVKRHFEDIGQSENSQDVTYENSQARERTQVLMDVANKTGGIVIGTGDLSELALGWATYNGDHMSMYGVNCSVPKTLVKHLVSYMAKKTGGKAEEILNDILSTPVSPELLPAKDGEIAQKTEDIVGPYVLHDFFLYYFVRMGYAPSKIYKIAVKTFENEFDCDTVYKWLGNFIRRFFTQQFKRSCIPDGVKLGSVSLSPRGDWRMPSDVSFDTWIKDLESV